MRRYHAVFVQKNKYTLRTWQTEDAHSLVQELNNKKIWDNCRNVFPHPYRLEHAETFIDLIQKKEGIHDFCIEVNGKAVGNIGFTPGTDVECFNAEVGYVIGEKYWNQGIVTDALQEAIYHYFTYTNTIRIFALVFEHNLPSMRVLEKAGFNKVGIMTKSIFKNGHFTNAHGSRRRIRRFYAATVLAPRGLNLPSSGTHTTPAPNRAHSGSHAETRGVFTA